MIITEAGEKDAVHNMRQEEARRLAKEYLIGAYDLHVHTSPSPFGRRQDGMELIRDADAAGMAGVMLKSHYESTAVRAALINTHSGCRAKAYGGLALNWPAGGLNVYGVENALKNGAKIIWMPTRDSVNSLRFGNMPGDFFDRPGISIWKDERTEQLKDVVFDILELVKVHNACLATGHISPEEAVVLCREGRRRNVRMVLTHPEFDRTWHDGAAQAELAALGVYLEKNWYDVAAGMVTVEQLAENIRKAGSRQCFMATDRGQGSMPAAVSEFECFIAAMFQAGIRAEEMNDLVRITPQKVLFGE